AARRAARPRGVDHPGATLMVLLALLGTGLLVADAARSRRRVQHPDGGRRRSLWIVHAQPLSGSGIVPRRSRPGRRSALVVCKRARASSPAVASYLARDSSSELSKNSSGLASLALGFSTTSSTFFTPSRSIDGSLFLAQAGCTYW